MRRLLRRPKLFWRHIECCLLYTSLVLLTEYPRLVPRAVRELKAPVDRRAQPRVVRKLEG